MVNETYFERLTHVLDMGSRDPLRRRISLNHNLRVGFSWRIKPEYACFYYAQQQGYYSREGLSISFQPGSGSENALEMLCASALDLLVLPCPFAVTAIQSGAPVKIIALYQHVAPVCLVSHQDNPVTRPSDLEGKTVAILPGETGTAFLEHFCAKNGVGYTEVGRRNVRPQDKLDAFRNRDVDVISVYRTNELPILRHSLASSLAELDLASFGLKIPGMSVVATDSLLQERPSILRQFLRATNKATCVALSKTHQLQAIVQTLCGHDNGAEITREQLNAFISSLPTESTATLGFCDDQMIDAYLAETGIEAARRSGRYTVHLETKEIDGHGSEC